MGITIKENSDGLSLELDEENNEFVIYDARRHKVAHGRDIVEMKGAFDLIASGENKYILFRDPDSPFISVVSIVKKKRDSNNNEYWVDTNGDKCWGGLHKYSEETVEAAEKLIKEWKEWFTRWRALQETVPELKV